MKSHVFSLVAIFTIFAAQHSSVWTAVTTAKEQAIQVDNYIYQEYTHVLHKEKNMFDSVVKLIMAEPLPALFQMDPDIISLYPVGTASGFSIKYDKKIDTSYILTNDHFCNNPNPNSVVFLQTTQGVNGDLNSAAIIEATVIHSDPSYDLCLVSVPKYIRPAVLASSAEKVRPFDKLILVGAPAGVVPIILETYTSGYLTRRDGLMGRMTPIGGDFILVTGEIIGGHSGGPIFNKKGKVVGIIYCGRVMDGVPIYGGLAIPISDVDLFLSKISFNL
jgi:S1-C subfamily serine protease